MVFKFVAFLSHNDFVWVILCVVAGFMEVFVTEAALEEETGLLSLRNSFSWLLSGALYFTKTSFHAALFSPSTQSQTSTDLGLETPGIRAKYTFLFISLLPWVFCYSTQAK